MKKILILSIFVNSIFIICAQNINPVIFGYWQGKVSISASDSLTVGLNISQIGDSVSVELDSPDQYVTGIPASHFEFKDSLISWKIVSLSASYKGTLSSSKHQMIGKFTQRGASMPLTLTKSGNRLVINRPQEPKPPYPYKEEEIRLWDKNHRYYLINGTLTTPTGPAKALVILITGSGWQDRDETIFGHKPFKVIADNLTRQGYAVFRYDDFPPAIMQKSTTLDFKDGVRLIMDTMLKRTEFQHIPTGLLGHSEGSLVAFITAAEDKRVDFVISLSGVGQPMKDILLYQLAAIERTNDAGGMKLTDNEIANSVLISGKLYDVVIKAKTPEQAKTAYSKYWDKYTADIPEATKQRLNLTKENKIQSMNELCSPWFFTILHLNPKDYLKKMTCPVLAIGGSKDLQVEAKSNLQLMQEYLKKNTDNQFITVESANHLLQICNTGNPSEYGKIEQTIAPQVLEVIDKWMENR